MVLKALSATGTVNLAAPNDVPALIKWTFDRAQDEGSGVPLVHDRNVRWCTLNVSRVHAVQKVHGFLHVSFQAGRVPLYIGGCTLEVFVATQDVIPGQFQRR